MLKPNTVALSAYSHSDSNELTTLSVGLAPEHIWEKLRRLFLSLELVQVNRTYRTLQEQPLLDQPSTKAETSETSMTTVLPGVSASSAPSVSAVCYHTVTTLFPHCYHTVTTRIVRLCTEVALLCKSRGWPMIGMQVRSEAFGCRGVEALGLSCKVLQSPAKSCKLQLSKSWLLLRCARRKNGRGMWVAQRYTGLAMFGGHTGTMGRREADHSRTTGW